MEVDEFATSRPRVYAHVLKAVRERPWALLPSVLTLMADITSFRAEGGRFTADEIEERLAAAKAANGERAGGFLVGSVAVIPLYGLITQRASLMSDMSGGTSVEDFRNILRAALADPSVQAVVVDTDSPGGSVDGIPEMAAELRSLRATKPIVAQVNTLAASAAYWLASSMSEIVVTPSGEVGSIGVYAAHEDVSRAEEMAGVKTTLVSAGPFKTEASPYEPLTDDARSAMQDQVDTFYGMFLSDVAKGRQTPVGTVARDYGQGRTLLAQKALDAGMVDRIDTLEATVRRLQPKATPKARAATPPTTRAAAVAARPDQAWNERMRKGRTLK